MDLQQKISVLESNIDKLIGLHEKLKTDYYNLRENYYKSVELVGEKEKTIKELEDKMKMLKLAKRLDETGEKNTDVKLKINELVREVDRCIALLNE